MVSILSCTTQVEGGSGDDVLSIDAPIKVGGSVSINMADDAATVSLLCSLCDSAHTALQVRLTVAPLMTHCSHAGSER